MKKLINFNIPYYITECGDVYRVKKSGESVKLKLNTSTDYLRVGLYKDKKQKFYTVHRLVAETFIPNPENKPQVNHIDGNKHNNCVNNLEWCTIAENRQHAYENGLQQRQQGSKHGATKLDESDVIKIRQLYADGLGQSEIAKQYGVTKHTIHFIVKRRSWKHI